MCFESHANYQQYLNNQPNSDLAFYGRPLSVAWAKSMLCFAKVILFIYFYGRETFTRGGPWVWIEKLLLGFFPGPPQTTGMGQKVTKFGIFQTPPANFLLSRGVTPERNVAEYCNAEKKLVKHRWLLYTCARFGELWPTNPSSGRHIIVLKN